ncbi:MAG: adenylyl-sulfate kinase [Gammaproteobacteria bacterium]|nr:adenylyl-sulfate kinase [Gammaproteobacteria bacterium]MBU1480860.1 adenylyl-sulfate kinase [Gammaproteobacteria bacterium]
MKQKSNIVWHHASVTRDRRERLNDHHSAVIWFTGLSGSGKSTLSHAVEEKLFQMKCRTYVLDGDNIRHGLCADLGFSDNDRKENIRRIGETAKLFVDAGVVTLTAFISPFRSDRLVARQLFDVGDFIEVYCRCPLEICESRDVKGMYRRARAGEIQNFTGISSPYEEPVSPELIVDTGSLSLAQCVDEIIGFLRESGVIISLEGVR